MISSLARQDHALLIDCEDLNNELVSIPDNLSLIIVNSNVQGGPIKSEYNLRREQCESVAKHFRLDSLRHLVLNQLEESKAELY